MNIVVVGYGAMGKKLVETIGVTKGLGLIGVISKSTEIGVKSFDDLNQVPDVIIDFSSPEALESILCYATKNECAVVLATTGYSEKDLIQIKAASATISVVHTSNTSLGVTVLLEALKQIVPVLSEDFDIEVIEKHHNLKVDSPSGTAKMIVNKIKDNMRTNPELVYGRDGLKKRSENEIGIHSLRGGTITGEHSVIFAGDDEIIEIKHQAMSKKIFVNGALKAAVFANLQEPGLYTMKDVLFNKGE